MLDICLALALLFFSSFCYLRLRKAIPAFLNSEFFKIRKEFLELDSLKIEIETLKESTLKKFDNLSHLRSDLIEETKRNTENLIDKKRSELKVLKKAKLASVKDFLELIYKRKEAEVKKHLLNQTHHFLSEELSKSSALDPQGAMLEIAQIIAKM